jgi:DNA-binding NtrC family response regulator
MTERERSRPRMSKPLRPVLFPIATVGERFVVGEPPIDLSLRPPMIVMGRAQAKETGEASRIPLHDPWLSRAHAKLVMTSRRWTIEDMGSRNGVLVNGARTQMTVLANNDIVETGRTFFVYRDLPADVDDIELDDAPTELGGMATWSPQLARILLLLTAELTRGSHLLLGGPSGVGKGFLARTLHTESRRLGRFIHFDARAPHLRGAAIELFGDKQQRGRFGDSHGGTLLLENVDALAVADQQKLATWVVRQRSPDKTRPIDARLVATTSMPIAEAVAAGVLLAELVAVFDGGVHILPGLADRRCDVGLLLEHALVKANVKLAPEALRALLRYDFGEHVRGMMRVVDAAISLASPDGDHGRVVGLPQLPAMLHPEDLDGRTGEGAALTVPPDDEEAQFFAELERTVNVPAHTKHDPSTLDGEALQKALREARGNVAYAATALGQPRALLLRWIDELNLDLSHFRG